MKNIWISNVLCIVFSIVSVAQSSDNLLNSCDSGDMHSCYLLGLNYMDGEGLEKDLVKGSMLLTHACKGQHSNSCVVLGWLFLKDEKVKHDYKRANDYFVAAGLLKNAGGYQGFATIYENGYGVKKDEKIVLSSQEYACKYGSPFDCHTVGSAYEKGEIVEKNLCTALYFYTEGCNFNIPDICEEYERLKTLKECYE